MYFTIPSLYQQRRHPLFFGVLSLITFKCTCSSRYAISSVLGEVVSMIFRPRFYLDASKIVYTTFAQKMLLGSSVSNSCQFSINFWKFLTDISLYPAVFREGFWKLCKYSNDYRHDEQFYFQKLLYFSKKVLVYNHFYFYFLTISFSILLELSCLQSEIYLQFPSLVSDGIYSYYYFHFQRQIDKISRYLCNIPKSLYIPYKSSFEA